MKEKRKVRNKWLTIRLSEEEEEMLFRLKGKTTSGSLSEYARKILLKEPVTVIYRNQVADEFLLVMIHLKTELNAIGKNFNEVVHKLHSLDSVSQVQAWIASNESSKNALFQKLEEIIEQTDKIYKLWWQK